MRTSRVVAKCCARKLKLARKKKKNKKQFTLCELLCFATTRRVQLLTEAKGGNRNPCGVPSVGTSVEPTGSHPLCVQNKSPYQVGLGLLAEAKGFVPSEAPGKRRATERYGLLKIPLVKTQVGTQKEEKQKAVHVA